ncbi:Ankyrin repeats (3 copies) [compost metagenome]
MNVTTTQSAPPHSQLADVHKSSTSSSIPDGLHNTSNIPEKTPLISPPATRHHTLNKNNIDWFKAVMTNDCETIESLIKNGVDVNIKGPGGRTALVYSLFGDIEGETNIQTVTHILQAKDLHISKDTAGVFLNTLRELKKTQETTNTYIKYQKITKEEPALNKFTIDTDKKTDALEQLYTRDDVIKWQKAVTQLVTPPKLTETQKNWFEAIKYSDTEAINQMIQSATNINITDHLGRTALWLSAYNGDVDLLEILLASDGLNIDKQTAGEFHTDLFVLRDCMISGKIDKEEIRKALTELTTDPYPSVYAPLLEKVGGTSPHDTSIFNRLKQSLFTTICVNTGFRN